MMHAPCIQRDALPQPAITLVIIANCQGVRLWPAQPVMTWDNQLQKHINGELNWQLPCDSMFARGSANPRKAFYLESGPRDPGSGLEWAGPIVPAGVPSALLFPAVGPTVLG